MFSNKNRPYLIHLHAILTDSTLSIRIGISSRPLTYQDENKNRPVSPIHDFRLLRKNNFEALIKIYNLEQKLITEKKIETDQFGHLNLKFPSSLLMGKENKFIIKVFETSYLPGIQIFLGERKTKYINPNLPIIISDFDKTLVDTKYKTTMELYRSLTSPLENFPTVTNTLEKISPLLEIKAPFFVLSASPHFYENAIRDWLRSKEIKDSGIFLKDYRQFFSWQNTELFSKDIKIHGTFKLSQLLNLIYMLNWPKEIYLFGDNSETDPLIYVLFNYIISASVDATIVWEKIKSLDAFSLTPYQDSKILNRLHTINGLKKKYSYIPKIQINIRLLKKSDQIQLPKWLGDFGAKIETYH